MGYVAVSLRGAVASVTASPKQTIRAGLRSARKLVSGPLKDIADDLARMTGQ